MRTGLALVLLLAGAVVVADAQNAAADPLGDVRTKPEITDADRGQIRTFINENIATIVAHEPLAANEATERLRAGFTGTDPFKRAYAAAFVEAVGSAYKKADLVPAVRLLALMNTFGAADAQGVLLEALRDDRVAVRAAAAVGLDGQRAQIAARGTEAVNNVLAALLAAGKQEKSSGTLSAIYNAMNYAALDSPPDLKRNAAAVLELINARAALYAGSEVTALGADDTGVRVAGALLSAYDDAQKQQLTTAAAKIMKAALERYIFDRGKLIDVRDKDSRERIETRNAIERLIEIGEDLLAELLKPAQGSVPDVFGALRKLDSTAAQLEWKKWNALLKGAVNQDFSLTPAEEAPATPPAAAPAAAPTPPPGG